MRSGGKRLHGRRMRATRSIPPGEGTVGSSRRTTQAAGAAMTSRRAAEKGTRSAGVKGDADPFDLSVPWLPLDTPRVLASAALRYRFHQLLGAKAMHQGPVGVMTATDILASLLGVSPARIEVLYALMLVLREGELRAFTIDTAEFEVALYRMPRQDRADVIVDSWQRVRDAFAARQQNEQAPPTVNLDAAQVSPTVQ